MSFNRNEILERKESSNAKEESQEERKKRMKLPSIGAILFSLVGIYMLTLMTLRAYYMRDISRLDNEDLFPPQGAIAGILILLGWNLLSKKLFKGKFLISHGNFVFVYIALMIGGFIGGQAYVTIFPIMLTALTDRALVNPERFASYTDLLSDWIIIRDSEAIFSFLFGGASVPWNVWIVPLSIWTLFFGVLLFAFLCLVHFVRKNWTDEEHLGYPLTIPVTQMVGLKNNAGNIWKSKVFYIGALYPVLLLGSSIVASIFPGFPVIPNYFSIGTTWEMPWAVVSHHPNLYIVHHPVWIGIGWFLRTDLTFSIGFFILLIYVQKIIAAMFGAYAFDSAWPYKNHQMLGGTVMLALYTLFLARFAIIDIFKKAFHSTGSAHESEEGMEYKTVVFGFILSFVFIIAFCTIMLKLPLHLAVSYFIIYFCAVIAFARYRAQAGIPSNACFPYLQKEIKTVLGSNFFGPNKIGLGFFWHLESWNAFGALPAAMLDSYKLGDEAKVNRKTITCTIVLAFIVTSIIGFGIGLPMIYEHGMYSLNPFLPDAGSRSAFNQLFWIPSENTPDLAAVFVTGISAVFTAFLAFMQGRFVWWPFNPIGFAIAANDWIRGAWFSLLLVWFIKVLVYRYGGHIIARKLTPAFMGMIIGAVIMGIVSVIITNIRVIFF